MPLERLGSHLCCDLTGKVPLERLGSRLYCDLMGKVPLERLGSRLRSLRFCRHQRLHAFTPFVR